MKTLKTYDIYYRSVLGGIKRYSVKSYSLFRSLKKIDYKIINRISNVVVNNNNVVPGVYLSSTIERVKTWHEKSNQ